MILFYAQSENSEIVVTSPMLTFPGGVSAAGNSTEPYLYGVQPISYTLPDGTSYDFNGTDIKKFLYEPKNNGHNIIRVQFIDAFKGNSGCVITLRASFLDGRFQTFTLPFAKSKIQTTSNASTEALTISINSKGYRSPITSATVFSNSTKESTIINKDSSFISIDTNNYPETKNGTLEIVGGIADTSVIDSKLFTDAIKNSKTKYLISKFFVDNAANASYFYIYAEECDKTITAVKGCFEANADNTTTAGAAFIGISSNSCNYARRAPNNVVIEHIPGAKETLASVKYIEENLPQDTDPIDETTDFDVHSVTTYINGSANEDSTPTSETINVDGTNTLAIFEWDDINSDSGFKRPLNKVQDKGLIKINSNVGSSNDDRSYLFPYYVTGSSGCTDPNSLNYDSTATSDDGSCISCDRITNEITRGIGFETFVDSNAVAIDNDDTTNLVVSSILVGADLPAIQYLSTLAATIWTADIYKAGDVSLNNFGEQATISGSVVINNSSLGGNLGTSTLPLFNKVPTSSSGLNSGRSFVVQITLTLGSCVHYFYKTFGVPFNGCSEPSASNYIPNPLNTGNGACDFDISNRSNCDGSIQASLSPGVLTGGMWQYNLSLQGTFDEYGNLLSNSETVYTITRTYYINGDYASQNSNTFTFPGSPANLPQLLNQGQPGTNYSSLHTITDSTTGCSIELLFESPLTSQVLGCTDSSAENYNPLATEDDGTCLFCNGEIEVISIVQPTGSGTGCSSSDNGVIRMSEGINIPAAYQYYSRRSTGGPTFGPWIPLGTYGEGDRTFTNMAPGFYQIKIEYQVSSDYMCTVYLEGDDLSVKVFSGVITLGVDTSGCGCTDPEANNYDSTATSDDGTCIRFGCTDKLAINVDTAATVDDGSCVYSAEPDSPLCIPDQLDDNQKYSTFLEGLANCVVNEGTTLLLKTKGGIKCDTIEQVKLSLITYLLNRIGLECMYNCNYTFAHGDEEISCASKWVTGGPSGKELVWVSGTAYVKGDIIQYTDAEGEVYYIEFLANFSGTTSTPDTWSLDGVKLKRCENVILPSGTETYLNTFINFARKFCTVCLVPSTSTEDIMQTTTNTLNDIQFENGDNINLNG